MILMLQRRGLVVLFVVAFNSSHASNGTLHDGNNPEKVKTIINRLERLKNPSGIDSVDSLWSELGKCGFRLSFDVVGIWQSLHLEQQSRIFELLQPTQMQKDTVIGRFRIHYDTTGFDEPALLDNNNQRIPGSARAYIDSVGFYFNQVWSYEMDTLEYTAPPIQLGDLYYNVYVENLGPSLYGETRFFPDPINPGQTPPRYTTFVRIHNDFQPFFSKGIEGLKVTAAHEFHHAIQVGSYGYWGSDIYFYEITSTWMEDAVYDDINDYYQYIRTISGMPRGHFDTPHRSLNVANGLIEYSRAIWGKFVEKRFDRSLMRRTWEFMRQQASVAALTMAFSERQSNLREAYNEFAFWNYFTGNRSDTVNFYTEANNYPEIRLEDTLEFLSPLTVFSSPTGSESLGAAYYLLFLNSQRSISTSPIVVKNNIDEAGNGVAERFQYIIRTDGGDDSYVRFQVDNNVYWTKIGGVTNPADWEILLPGVKVISSRVLVYPSPFYVGQDPWVRFEVPDENSSEGSIYIFTSGMELTFSENQNLGYSPLRSRFFTWNGRSHNKDLAASGVYFYLLEVNGHQYTGKFVLLRK